MSTVHRFEDLDAWKKARELSKLVYGVTRSREFNIDVRLRYQMRDASVSILSNIAEGFGRRTDKEFIQFLYVSRGSTTELQAQSYVALDQNYVNQETFSRLYEMCDHTARLMTNLIKYLHASVESNQRAK
jgi:four helix bundle protein